MDLKIEKVIINELIKEQNGEPDVFISDEELDCKNEQLVSVIKALDAAFSKKTEKKAKLSDDGFSKSSSWNSEEFLFQFAKEQTNELKKLVKGKPATGGYIIFCLSKKKHRFLSIFIVRNTKSAHLQKQGTKWDVETVTHLDTKNFAMGCRINLSLYNEKSEDRYLSFIRGNTDISKYFEIWVGVKEERSESKDVDALISIVERIKLPEDFEDTSEFKQAIFNYVKSSRKNRINMRDLGQYFYKDEQRFVDFAEEQGIDLDGEFKITTTQLNKFYRIFAKVSGVTLQAPLEKIGKGAMVEISEENKVVMIRSAEMVKKIKEQVNGNTNGK